MIEDYTTKESFEVISMFYTTILFTLKRMLISMVRSKIAQIKNRSSGCSGLYNNFVHFEAMAHTNDMIEDCTTKELFESGGIFFTTILFALKWMVKVSGTIEDPISNEKFNNNSVQIFYSLRENIYIHDNIQDHIIEGRFLGDVYSPFLLT